MASPRAVTHVDREIGKIMRRCRLEAEITQQGLAERLGITFQQIQKYEKGINRVSVSMLIDICAALGMRATAILDEYYVALYGLPPTP